MSMGRIDRERTTIEAMIRPYCRRHHDPQGDVLCPCCQELLEYAFGRTKACRFGEDKPACAKCAIHCYKPDMRTAIIEVMRWSGPRMLWCHPYLAIRHLFDSMKLYPRPSDGESGSRG